MSRSITEVAIGLLSRREHTRLELSRKLRSKGFNENDIAPVIEQLVTNNCLSDERFTESYINMRKHKGYGPLRIAQELRERGVDTELVDEFLDRNSPEWRAILQQQYSRKYGDEPVEEYSDRAKRAKFLQNRGFPLDWVFSLTSMDDM